MLKNDATTGEQEEATDVKSLLLPKNRLSPKKNRLSPEKNEVSPKKNHFSPQTRRGASWLHYLVLSLACILLFGNYYCYDIPGSLNTQLRTWLGRPQEEWQFEMNGLYAAYSFPNLIVPIVGGVLVDMMGPSRILLIFSIIVCVGQAAFTAGIQWNSYWLMICGRVLFGIGGESLEVIQASITTQWFADISLGFALGLNLTSARLATALNDTVSPLLARRFSPAMAALFGLLTCFLSLGAGVLLGFLHGRHPSSPQYDSLPSTSPSCSKDSPSCSKDQCEAAVKEDEDIVSFSSTAECSNDVVPSFRWYSIAQLPPAFWLLCMLIMVLYGAVNPFIHILAAFLQSKWNYSEEQAGTLMSIPDLVSSVGSPLFGFLLDRYCTGHSRLWLVITSAILLIAVHLVLLFVNITPIVALLFLGVTYSLFGAGLWPLVSQFISDHRYLGTAYGVSTVLLNVSLTVVPLLVATLMNMGGFVAVQWFFVAMSICGIVLSAVLLVVAKGRVDSLPSREPADS